MTMVSSWKLTLIFMAPVGLEMEVAPLLLLLVVLPLPPRFVVEEFGSGKEELEEAWVILEA